jgi:Tol biopolymer transport system component
MGKLFEDLKRRKVFRVAAVYAVSAWVLIQIADVVLPTFGAPGWVNQTIIFLFILGFIPTLIAAWAYEVTPEGVRPDSGGQAPESSTSSSDRNLIYATFGLVLLVAGFQISDRFLQTPEQAASASDSSVAQHGVTRVSVNIPADQFFHPARGDFDISDDGTAFVYRGATEAGQPMFWYRRWDELRARPLSGTEGGTRPHFSPNGEEIVYAGFGAVRVVHIASGVSRALTGGNTDSPTWSYDGQWVYFHDTEQGLSRVPAQGGQRQVIRRVNRDNGERALHAAHALPGDRTILYTSQLLDGGNLIHALNLETGEDQVLIQGKNPIYSSTGHLLFQSNEEPTLLAARFDIETLEISGSAVPIVTGLYLVGQGEYANIGVSKTGRMVYRLGESFDQLGSPVWVTRDGQASEIDEGWLVSTVGGSGILNLSPAGDRMVLQLIAGSDGPSIWIKRLDAGPLSRLTFESTGSTFPIWSEDGQTIFYSGGDNSNTGRGIWSRRADGSGESELVISGAPGTRAEEMTQSPDGRWLVYRQWDESFFLGNLYAYDLQSGGEPVPLLVNEYFTRGPAFSTDGQWLAYVSDESGRDEVYVRPFPDFDSGRWQVSLEGGTEPVWSNSGEELFYRNSSGELVAVKLSEGDSFDWDSQEVLFSASEFRFSQMRSAYDTSPDDQRFAMVRLSANNSTELILVDNWMEDLP